MRPIGSSPEPEMADRIARMRRKECLCGREVKKRFQCAGVDQSKKFAPARPRISRSSSDERISTSPIRTHTAEKNVQGQE